MSGISSTVLNPGSGGDAIIDVLDTNGKKWPVSAIATIDGSGTPGTLVGATNPFPIRICDGSGFVTVPVATQLPAALGQATMSASMAVVIASNQSAIPVSGTVTATAAQGTAAGAAAPWSVELSDGGAFYTAAKTGQFPTALVGGRLDVNIGAVAGTIPISAAALPLPTGAALDATLTGGTATTRITDGTNTATVKAASVAAVATDKAVVVAISPNNTVPVSAASLPALSGTTAVSIAATVAVSAASLPALSGTTAVSLASLPAVTGTVTSNQGTANTLANAWPVELSDGTNLLGVAAHPVRTDPTGTTTQPVSGTVAVSGTVPISAASLPALSGTTAVSIAATVPVSIAAHVTADQGTAAAATVPWSVELSDGGAFYTGVKTGQLPAALVGGRVDVNTGAWLGSTAPTVGSKTSANSIPVVIASDQGNVPVTLSGSPAISGTVTANQGTANSAANRWPVTVSDGTNSMPTGDAVTRALFTKTTDGTNTAAVKAASTAAVASDPALVVAVSPNSVVTVNEVSSTTAGACARQTVGVASGSILASNASRKRAIITNVGIYTVYLGLGQTPTATAYHVALSACANSADDGSGGTYILDVWDGAINAICLNAAGAVCVVEMT